MGDVNNFVTKGLTDSLEKQGLCSKDKPCQVSDLVVKRAAAATTTAGDTDTPVEKTPDKKTDKKNRQNKRQRCKNPIIGVGGVDLDTRARGVVVLRSRNFFPCCASQHRVSIAVRHAASHYHFCFHC